MVALNEVKMIGMEYYNKHSLNTTCYTSCTDMNAGVRAVNSACDSYEKL